MAVTVAQLDVRLTALEKRVNDAALMLTADQLADIATAFPKALTITVNGGTGGGTTTQPGTGGGTTTPPNTTARTARLEINLSSNPANPDNNTVAILVDGKIVKAPVEVVPHVGASLTGSLSVVADVQWTDKSVVSINGIAPNGINGLWMNSASIDYVTLVANGEYNSRGGAVVNAPQVFISNGANLTLTLPVEVAPAPPPPPVVPMTVVSGAKINGAVRPNATLSALVAATPAGGTLELPEGIITGTAAVPVAMTIKGAGKDKTFIDGTGIAITYGKGGFVPLVPGSMFQDMTIRNMSCPDLNGAGIRDNDEGIGFKATRVRFKGNQNGVLTFRSNYTFDDCDFEENGAGDGYSHNFYVNGSPTSVLTMTNCRSSGPKGGHAGKSRAGTTNLTNCTFAAGGDGGALDVPDGGTVNANNLTLIQPGTGATHIIMGLGQESAGNAAAGMVLKAVGLHIEDPAGVGFIMSKFGASINLDATSTYKGPRAAPDYVGVTVTGTLTKVN